MKRGPTLQYIQTYMEPVLLKYGKPAKNIVNITTIIIYSVYTVYVLVNVKLCIARFYPV